MSLPLFCVFVALLPSTLNAEKCITPNNENAECIELYSCPILLEALVKTRNASVDFVRQSNCGGSAIDPKVCCGSLTVFASTTKNLSETTQTPSKGVLASRKQCGYQRSDDYFYIEHGTPVAEFPWLALLLFEYIDNNTLAPMRCGGALINDRYVLTAGHCINVDSLSLVAVRLGETNLKNSINCTDGSKYYECSNPIQDFKVAKVTRHPRFSITRFAYDVALLRLNKEVTYSDHIRPVCLPTTGYKVSMVGDILSSQQWGYSSSGGLMDVTKKASKRRISNAECESFLQLEKSGLPLTDDHFCTKALHTNISLTCGSEQGGPLMFLSAENQWQLEGILTFGGYCSDSVPEVYTKVMNYVGWIEENIFE